VEWARAHGCDALVALRDEDFEVWAHDVPAWNPTQDDLDE
jgi:hypothetical protein